MILSGWALPASGAGNAGLSAEIIANPVPGLVSVPQRQVATLVSQLQASETTELKGLGYGATVAAEEWRRPAAPAQDVYVYLVAISAPAKGSSPLSAVADQASSSASTSFCTGAANSPPVMRVAVAHIGDSHFVVCQRSPNGVIAEAVTAAKANILLVVGGTEETLGRARLEAIALRQYRALPSTPFAGS